GPPQARAPWPCPSRSKNASCIWRPSTSAWMSWRKPRRQPVGEASGETVQDGVMRETRVMTDSLWAAIERSGYYPGLVSDAVASALGSEPVTAYVVHHDAMFDPGMEVRRHMTVLALTPTRLVYSHTDEHPAEDADSRPRAETST